MERVPGAVDAEHINKDCVAFPVDCKPEDPDGLSGRTEINGIDYLLAGYVDYLYQAAPLGYHEQQPAISGRSNFSGRDAMGGDLRKNLVRISPLQNYGLADGSYGNKFTRQRLLGKRCVRKKDPGDTETDEGENIRSLQATKCRRVK
jgi:hypothetical protein